MCLDEIFMDKKKKTKKEEILLQEKENNQKDNTKKSFIISFSKNEFDMVKIHKIYF